MKHQPRYCLQTVGYKTKNYTNPLHKQIQLINNYNNSARNTPWVHGAFLTARKYEMYLLISKTLHLFEASKSKKKNVSLVASHSLNNIIYGATTFTILNSYLNNKIFIKTQIRKKRTCHRKFYFALATIRYTYFEIPK